MADEDAIARGRRSRGQYGRQARESVTSLTMRVNQLKKTDPVPKDELYTLERLIPIVQTKLDNFMGALVECQVLEDVGEADADEDENTMAHLAMAREFEEAQGLLGSIGRRMMEESDPITFNRNVGVPETGNRPVNAASQAPKLTAKPPPTMEKDIDHKKFIQWKKMWSNYSKIVKLDDRPEDQQRAHFWTMCTPDLLEKMNHAMDISDDSDCSMAEILTKMEQYLKDQRNVALDRMNLVKRRQHDGETFDDYYTSLCILAEDAQLRNMDYDAWMSTLITVGIEKEDTRQKLLSKTPTLDLKETLALCRSDEKGRIGNEDLEGQSKTMVAAAGHKRNNFTKNQKSKFRGKSAVGNEIQDALAKKKTSCGRCGYVHQSGRSCPALQQECNSCQRVGHFSKMCRAKRDKSQSSVPQRQNAIKIAGCIDREKPLIKLVITSHTGKSMGQQLAIPDTGAQGSVASLKVMENMRLKAEELDPPLPSKIVGINDQNLHSIGTTRVMLKLGGRRTEEVISFCMGITGFYLSREACKSLGIVPQNFPTPIPLDEQKIATIQTTKNRAAVTSPEEIKKMRECFLREFEDVFKTDGTLPAMSGPPMRIELRPDAVPYATKGVIPVAIPLRSAVWAIIESNVKNGIWEPMGDRPCEWLHPMVVTLKSNGLPRICIDLKRLNDQVARPKHPMKTPRDAITGISPKSRFFTTLDASNRYWQVDLHEDSRDLTCFITPWGRFRHCRAPMGFVASGDAYNLRGDEVFNGVPGVEKVVDDVLIATEGYQELVERVRTILERCRKYGVTLNPDKFVFGQEEVEYVGYKVSKAGIEANPERVSAIRDFPEPKTRTELRSFMGMVNQLGQFSSEIAAAAGPLRSALKTKYHFAWIPEYSEAMKEVKRVLISPPILSPFNPKAETALQTDASRTRGLGYVLLQRQESSWRLIQCGSRFLGDAETKYAMVELECLAILWAVKKCRIFLAGLPKFTVVTDHRPLVPILNKFTLDMVENARILKYKMALSLYQFNVVWRKGADHCIPDALSRAPVRDPFPDEVDESGEVHSQRAASIRIAMATMMDEEENTEIADPILSEIRRVSQQDDEYQALIKEIEEGVDSPLTTAFKKIIPELTTDYGLVLFGARIVIPKPWRKEALKRLHMSHQGVERTKRRARQTIYWPGMGSDIFNTVQACEKCQFFQPSQQKEPLCPTPTPSRVFECVSSDLFEFRGRSFLIYVDRLSGFPFVTEWVSDPTANQVVKIMRKYFVLCGVPVSIRTDGGPQFKAKVFQDFLVRWGVIWSPSTPYYPQSNGHAEVTVKSIKRLVAKTETMESDEFLQGLLEFRNTPRSDGRSPAQIVFGHAVRSQVPAHRRTFAREWRMQDDECDQKAAEQAGKVKEAYDKRARPLKPLIIGQSVRLQNYSSKRWDRVGTIVGIGKHRDYHIKVPSGRVCWLNRRFIRPIPSNLESKVEEQEIQKETTVEGEEEPKLRRSSRIRKKYQI